MVRRSLPLALALVALAGCGGRAAGRPAAPPLLPGAIALPPLPAQGLAVEDKSGVRLLGLDGHVYAHLAGFHRSSPNGSTRDFVLDNLDLAGTAPEPRLVGPRDRWYLLDAPGHRLLRLRSARIPLPGGAELVSHASVSSDGVGFEGYTVERNGKVLRALDRNLQLVAGRLVFSHHRLLDLATGDVRPVAPGCVPAGVRNGDVFAFCTIRVKSALGQQESQLVRLTANSGRVGLATLQLAASMAALSPDGRFVAAQLPYACGATYAAVVPTSGGEARLATGESRIDRNGNQVPFSTVLGWTADSKLIAYVTGPSCEGRVRTGTYVIDPATLKRRFVVAAYAAVWNPFPGG